VAKGGDPYFVQERSSIALLSFLLGCVILSIILPFTNTSTIVHASTTLAGSGTPTIDIITCRLLCGSACTCLRSVVTGHIRLTGHHVGRASDVLEVLDAREVPSCATVLRARNKPTQCCLVCSRRTQTNRKKVPWKILTKFFKNQSLSCEFFPQGFLQNF
jgi:hypothetical protein